MSPESRVVRVLIASSSAASAVGQGLTKVGKSAQGDAQVGRTTRSVYRRGVDIRTKLVFALVAVTLGSLTAFGLVMYGIADGMISRSTQEQLEGLAASGEDALESIVDGWQGKPEMRTGGSECGYSPRTDTTILPEMQAFENGEAYYRALFHELAHSTGHRTRLNRDGVANPVRFASHDYSEEELVAEMSAGMVAGHAGIDTPETVENSAAYLDHWLAKLKREPKMLSKAGGEAQKAADLIRGIKWEKAAK